MRPARLIASPDCETPAAPAGRLRCRLIVDDDLDAVVDLLARGFPNRPRIYWTGGLRRLGECARDPGDPKYGYLLDAGGATVGAILTITSVVAGERGPVRRTNLSSWYVRPDYRGWASALAFAAVRRRDVTYTNLSAAPHTWATIEAQGFRRYGEGTLFAAALLARSAPGARAAVFEQESLEAAQLTVAERRLLADHAALGCLSVVASGPDGVHPFVFLPMRVKGGRVPLPCAQLLYCPSPETFVRHAGSLGRLLLRRLRTPIVMLDACGPVEGLVGLYAAGLRPKFFKGGEAPRLGDLAYSELALFGA